MISSFISLCHKSPSLRQHFSAFVHRFAFLHPAWMQHKQNWRRVKMIQNDVILNRRRAKEAKAKRKDCTAKWGYFCRMDVVRIWKIWCGSKKKKKVLCKLRCRSVSTTISKTNDLFQRPLQVSRQTEQRESTEIISYRYFHILHWYIFCLQV